MADLSQDEQTGLMLKLHTINFDLFSCGTEPLRASESHAWWTDDDTHQENEVVRTVMDLTIHELAETELRIDLDRSFRAASLKSEHDQQGDNVSLKHTQGEAKVLSTLLSGASSKDKSVSKRITGSSAEKKPPSTSRLIRREKAAITMKTLAAITKLQLNFRRRRMIKQAEEEEREQHRKEAKEMRRRSFMEMTSELPQYHPCLQGSSHARRTASLH